MSLAWLFTIVGLHFTAVSLLRSEKHFEVEINPLDTPVDEGAPVLLDCKANAPLAKCSWSRQKYHVRPGITHGYELRGDFHNGDCSMFIKRSVFHHDNGRWKCHVTAEDTFENRTSNEALLDVYVPPNEVTILANMPDLYYKDQLMLYAGNDTAKLLTCQAKGSNPPASVTWLVDRDVIRGNEDVLSDARHKLFTVETAPNLTITTDYHQRNLTCQVTHPSWRYQPRKIKITLIVRHASSWIQISQPLVRNIHYGENTVLHCLSDGFPFPTITWFKKNSTFDGWEHLGHMAEIRVGLNLADHGIYRCSVQNFLNKQPLISEEATVNVMYATAEVSALSPPYLLVSPGEPVNLSCASDGYPEPLITWHKKQAGELWLPAAIGADFTILNVSVEDRGEYRCVAVNVLNSKEVVSPTVVRLEIIGYEDFLNKNASSLCGPTNIITLFILLLACYMKNLHHE